jgi:transcription elongation factor Elf1
MSLQVCPRCGVKRATWSTDEEESPWTRWYCNNCGYFAEEDETQKADCPRCAAKRSCILLRDSDGFHRWCSVCGRFESTGESFPL